MKNVKKTGNVGAPTYLRDNGEPPEKTTLQMEIIGSLSPTKMPYHAPTAGVKDGLLGFTDRECRLCFAIALWNEKDPILKERLFGLTGPESNHGEDVKELYYYLDSSPTHSYCKALYKYPQAEFPYEKLREENRNRGLNDPEYEIHDTGIFNEGRYFDVQAEYAKANPNDILIKITVSNRGPEESTLHLLPTLWFRNAWTWGCTHEGCLPEKPSIKKTGENNLTLNRPSFNQFHFFAEDPAFILTENESNTQKLWDKPSDTHYVKDAFHRHVVEKEEGTINPEDKRTKAAVHYTLSVAPGASKTIHLRLFSKEETPKGNPLGSSFESTFKKRIKETNEFYQECTPSHLSSEEKNIQRQAYAGMLWSKQFYHYSVKDWLEGDPNFPKPLPERLHGRNNDWKHLFNRDIVSMPDKWEYPWYAAWDLAFHTIPFAHLDAHFVKRQLILMLREWYMHANGQIPAYEFEFGDVNPPVHAWACWRVYKITAPKGKRDLTFLTEAFHKLLINFTWWVNRKDPEGRNLFSGGFLGLDNIGAFDRSKPLPNGGHRDQDDSTAWMAFYCSTMLSIALELAKHNLACDGVASKFFEHFMSITEAINTLGGSGLWNEEDGFYYDQLHFDDHPSFPVKIRSLVGLIPLLAVEILNEPPTQEPAGIQAAHRLVHEIQARPCSAHFVNAVPPRRRRQNTTCHPLQGKAHSRTTLYFRRRRIPLSLRNSFTLKVPQAQSLYCRNHRRHARSTLHPRRVR